MSTPVATPRKLSFVIPAYNEAEHIGRCVSSIREHVPAHLECEIIVVDNGSEDQTASIADASGARVIPSDARTIAGVRNEGVAASTGDVLVFIDGDCALTPQWEEGIDEALHAMLSRPMSCAGSQVTPPPDGGLLAEHWFIPVIRRASHIGSGHLMCARKDFDALGGFDERYETGEDYHFSQAFKGAGGSMLEFPDLRVDHYDFPRNLAEFVRRERWHGRGDSTSVGAVLASKVAMMSLLFTTVTLAGIVAIALGTGRVGLGFLGVGAGLLVVSSVLRLREVPLRTRALGVGIFAVYYFARALAVFDGLSGRASRSR